MSHPFTLMLKGEFARDPEALKVKEWRHKLQRAFLGKTIPTEEVCAFLLAIDRAC